MILSTVGDLKVRSPYPLPRAFTQVKRRNTSETVENGKSFGNFFERSLPSPSPIFKNFASRVLNSIGETSSSIGSLFSSSTPDDVSTNTTDDVSSSLSSPFGKDGVEEKRELIAFRRERIPRLPFCEGYDGVNMRKTKTISESITQILEIRRRNDTDTKDRFSSNLCDINCKPPTIEFMQLTYSLNETSEEISSSDLEDDAISPFGTHLCPFRRSLKQLKQNILDDKFIKVGNFPPIENYDLTRDRGFEEATVDLEIKYNMDMETLEVTVLRVEDVSDLRDCNRLINSFVKVRMCQQKESQKQKTKTAKHCRDPKFNHTFQFRNITPEWFHIECIHLRLFQKKRFRKVCIGEVYIWTDDLNLMGEDSVCITEKFTPCY